MMRVSATPEARNGSVSFGAEQLLPVHFILWEVNAMSKENSSRMSAGHVALVAMFTAVSFVAVLLAKVIPNVAGFLSYDPKDAVITVASFILGPITGVLITLMVSFIEMVSISSTGIYGFLMNAISTCAFVIPAACFYKRNRSQKSALTGLVLSVVVMAIVMVAWNYIITPFYMGVPREQVAGMLATVFLPFNLVKGGINAALTMLIYKPVVNALRATGLVAPSKGTNQKGKISVGFYLFALAVLVTFVLLFLVLIGVL